MILIPVIVIGVLFYAFFGMLIGRVFYNWRLRECGRCSNARRCITDHQTSAMFFGLGWPFSFFVVGGFYVIGLGLEWMGKTAFALGDKIGGSK